MIKTRTVRIRAVFRPGDEDAITVLRLAAAGNDLQSLMRLLLNKPEDAEADALRRYAFRMSALHINEITELVNHPAFSRVVERLSRRRALEVLPEMRDRLRRAINKGPLREVIGQARNCFGGHYDADAMAEALAEVEPWELMDLPGQGVRHNVVDRLFDISFALVSHKRYRKEDHERSVEAAMLELLDVHAALVPVVQALVGGLYMEAEGM